jgi:glycosyltransferase involved in cell wall biosynthesis
MKVHSILLYYDSFVAKNMNGLAIVYWGQRGGGLELFEQFINGAKSLGYDPHIFRRPFRVGRDGGDRHVGPLSILVWLSARRNLAKELKLNSINTVVFPMSSPWDLFLGKSLAKLNINVIRIIHDATPHRGEIFPPKFWIELLTKDCSNIIALSEFVSLGLKRNYNVKENRIRVVPMPIPSRKELGNTLNIETVNDYRRVLLIGRGKKYQGQRLLEKVWAEFGDGFHLTISGSGFKESRSQPNITYKIGWMEDGQMDKLISESDLVVLPYLEASQSGIIPKCLALQTPVLVTPVGGLPEQVINCVNGIILAEVSEIALIEGIKIGLSMNWNIPLSDSKESQMSFVKSCLVSSIN